MSLIIENTKQALGCEDGEISIELCRRLLRIRELVYKMNGDPNSHQIEAVIIEQWERDGRP